MFDWLCADDHLLDQFGAGLPWRLPSRLALPDMGAEGLWDLDTTGVARGTIPVSVRAGDGVGAAMESPT